MRKTALFLTFSLISVAAFAQVRTPRPSPNASLSQTVGTTDITIKYSRPGVKNRPIWGALVPYDKVWRTGANESTIVTFSEDVTVNGQALKKGAYSLHSIPGASEWTLIFNSAADPAAPYSYDEAKNVLSVKTTPRKGAFAEWLEFGVPAMSNDDATFVLRWENLEVPFTVATNSTKRTIEALKSSVKPNWQPYYQMALLAYDKPGAATDDEINAWLADSIKITENLNNLWLKARMQKRAGQTAEAKKTAEAAIAKANAGQAGLAEDIKRQIAGWK